MVEILYKDESYRIIGSCMAVHKKLGNGFLESVYTEALEIQFAQENIPFVREKTQNSKDKKYRITFKITSDQK